MKVEVEIPDGKYCGDCELLGWDKGVAEDCECQYCCNIAFGILTYGDKDYDWEYPIKHFNCPSLKEEK